MRERIAVCFSSNPRAQYLDRARGAHGAAHGRRAVFAIYVDIGQQDNSEQDQNSLNANMQFAESLGAKVDQAERQRASPQRPRNSSGRNM